MPYGSGWTRQRRSWRSWLTRQNGRANNGPSLAGRERRRGLFSRRSLTRQSLSSTNVVARGHGPSAPHRVVLPPTSGRESVKPRACSAWTAVCWLLAYVGCLVVLLATP